MYYSAWTDEPGGASGASRHAHTTIMPLSSGGVHDAF